MSMKDYKDTNTYPDSAYVSLKIAPRLSQLLKLEELRFFSISSKKILKTIVLKRIHNVLAPSQTFHFNYVFKKPTLIFSLLVHYTSPSSPFPPVPVVNIMSRDTTPVTKCLYHFFPPTTWKMKIITKPHP